MLLFLLAWLVSLHKTVLRIKFEGSHKPPCLHGAILQPSHDYFEMNAIATD